MSPLTKTILIIRLNAHTVGRVKSTKNRGPVELIYYEASKNKTDAFKREKHLKTAYGRRYLKNRLKEYSMG